MWPIGLHKTAHSNRVKIAIRRLLSSLLLRFNAIFDLLARTTCHLHSHLACDILQSMWFNSATQQRCTERRPIPKCFMFLFTYIWSRWELLPILILTMHWNCCATAALSYLQVDRDANNGCESRWVESNKSSNTMTKKDTGSHLHRRGT